MHEPGSSRPFLPAARTRADVLAAEIAVASASPVISAILEASDAAIAVLDANRQVIAFNAAFLEALGVDRPAEALGLRLGEALRCVHAQEVETGCGTTPACPSCGAAVAQLAALTQGRTAELRCALRARSKTGATVDRELRVRVAPFEVEGHAFLLAALHDVTAEARRRMIERSFLHDLSNLATGLDAAAEALAGGEDEDAADDVRMLARRLVDEVRLRKLLAVGDVPAAAKVPLRPVELSATFAVLRRVVERHPAAAGRAVEWPRIPAGLAVRGESALLGHVLVNMALNALEAVPAGARIRVEVVAGPAEVRMRVWNPGAIPAAIVPRVFQRYFSTKPEPGRGHGTWAMKHLGEDMLGGRVSFETSAEAGTTFELALPRTSAPAC